MLVSALLLRPKAKVAETIDQSEQLKLAASISRYILPSAPSPSAPVIVPGESLAQIEAKKKKKISQTRKVSTPRVKSDSTIISVGPSGPAYSSCVLYVERITGVNLSLGAAKNWGKMINSQEPKIGSVVILAEGPLGHVGKQIGEDSDAIIIDDANFIHNTQTIRRIPKNSPVIRGYYHL